MGMHPLERLIRFLYHCECCYDGCDCGCLLECPMRRNHAAYEPTERETGE